MVISKLFFESVGNGNLTTLLQQINTKLDISEAVLCVHMWPWALDQRQKGIVVVYLDQMTLAISCDDALLIWWQAHHQLLIKLAFIMFVCKTSGRHVSLSTTCPVSYLFHKILVSVLQHRHLKHYMYYCILYININIV